MYRAGLRVPSATTVNRIESCIFVHPASGLFRDDGLLCVILVLDVVSFAVFMCCKSNDFGNGDGFRS